MSNVKSVAKPHGMRYEETGTKGVKDVHGVAIKMAESLSTARLLWIVTKRHKVAILATGNIVFILNTIYPAWFDNISSLVH